MVTVSFSGINTLRPLGNVEGVCPMMLLWPKPPPSRWRPEEEEEVPVSEVPEKDFVGLSLLITLTESCRFFVHDLGSNATARAEAPGTERVMLGIALPAP
mmetsp:Transcript_20007/g.31702  ORF Transcript_20007/g.31702 Transcript_20007/m.31702 type:complete len:100 (+) Transcript_20007:5558-5857(+)